MTHDELLDKIKNKSQLEDCWMALQKVVQLHKTGNGEASRCEACYLGFDCPTIQAIEKELGQ